MTETQKFKQGIFHLQTRRFGIVTELLIRKLYGFSKSNANEYDAKDGDQRIEIKFSRVLKKSPQLTDNNALECVKKEGEILKRTFSIQNVCDFSSNIEQIKVKNFDYLYYGLFFLDKILIFKVSSEKLIDCINNEQINGNSFKISVQHPKQSGGDNLERERQFFITNETLKYHIKNHKIKEVTYEQVMRILKAKKK